MKKEFTPGEWFQSHRQIPNDPDGMYATQVYTEDGETICSLDWCPKPKQKGIHDGQPVMITGTYREANAKLIASAPDLLEASIKMSEAISTGNNHLLSEANLEMKTAIKKAIG